MALPLIVSLDELKTYLGFSGPTGDDALLASVASNATAQAEADTGRYFSVRSNHTERYSSNGQASLTILDVPYEDSGRTVTWLGATLVADTNYWLLPDRRYTATADTLQLRYYDYSRPDWWKASPNWFDANLDRHGALGASPNDVVVSGTHGMPNNGPNDVHQAVLELAAWFYYRAKSGASGFINSPTGEEIDLGALPDAYAQMVKNWRVTTGVAAI
jgi:hypothetical protein